MVIGILFSFVLHVRRYLRCRKMYYHRYSRLQQTGLVGYIDCCARAPYRRWCIVISKTQKYKAMVGVL